MKNALDEDKAEGGEVHGDLREGKEEACGQAESAGGDTMTCV